MDLGDGLWLNLRTEWDSLFDDLQESQDQAVALAS